MKKFIYHAFLFLGMLPVFGQGLPAETHPIDFEMERCIKQDPTQSDKGVARCEMAALKAWKAEVQKNYDTLIAILPGPDQKKLKEAQKQWQAYADTEAIFARGAYSDKEKFQYGVVPLSRAIDILRQRAANLKEYYDLLNSY
jgi:uncharacterized protein YecT (DUF1311 family)